MFNFSRIQELFNSECDFEKLKNETFKYIENNLSGNVDYSVEDILPDGFIMENFKIEYSHTIFIFNCSDDKNPTVRIVFNIIKVDNRIPSYTYEVDYNCIGEFSDEYFLEY